MSFLFKRKNFGFWYIGYYDESKKLVRISTNEKLRTRADIVHDNFKKKKSKNIVPDILYFKDVQDIIFNFIKNNFAPTTLLLYKNAIRNLDSLFGYKPIKSISLIDIEEYKSRRLKAISPVTLNIELRTIRAFFNYCVEFNLLSHNQLSKISQIRIQEKKLLTFSSNEINLILGNIKHTKLRQIVTIGAYTGMRLNEILTLKYSCINLTEKIIEIINTGKFTTKTKKNRIIPVPDTLLDELSVLFFDKSNCTPILVDPESYIFSSDGKTPFNKSYATRKFKSVLRKLNLNEDLHFHCLRHTYFSNLSRLNVPVNYIKELAGHSSIKTTEIYLHNFRQDLNNFVSGFKY
ncbi:MAG: site-specific integrase [Ignavibacteria bacterium]|nr:site-specific integrase [Ignavibacteria bacterium]